VFKSNEVPISTRCLGNLVSLLLVVVFLLGLRDATSGLLGVKGREGGFEK